MSCPSTFGASSNDNKPAYNSGISPISNEHIDIWEHAALLYLSYEWFDARDTFEYLARVIRQPKYAMACIINVGLIQARLGDLDSAMTTFQRALQTNAAMAIIYFLIALTEAELGKLPQAELAYQICIGVLKDQASDHELLGFAYHLSPEIVKQNIRAGRESLSTNYLALERIPAEIIFEAPARASETPGRESQSQWSPDELQGIVQRELSRPATFQAHDTPPALTREALEAFLQTQDQLHSADVSPLSSRPEKPWSDASTVTASRPTNKNVARDARIQAGPSARELTSFIRELDKPLAPFPPKKKKMVPRDARAVPESVGELARIINVTYPGMSIRTAQLLLENEPYWASQTTKKSSEKHFSTRSPFADAFDPNEVEPTPRATLIEPQSRYSRPSSAPASRQLSPHTSATTLLQRGRSHPTLTALRPEPSLSLSSEADDPMEDAELFGLLLATRHDRRRDTDEITRLTDQIHAEIADGEWMIPSDRPELLKPYTYGVPNSAGSEPKPADGQTPAYDGVLDEYLEPGTNLTGLYFDSAPSSRSPSTVTIATEPTLRPAPLFPTPLVTHPALRQQENRAELVRPQHTPSVLRKAQFRKPLPPVPTSARPGPSKQQTTAPPPLPLPVLNVTPESSAPSSIRALERPPLVERRSPIASIADSLDVLGFGKRWKKVLKRRS